MLLPNMYASINLFAQNLVIYNVVQSVFDFEPVNTLTRKNIVCTVQRYNPESLQIDNVDLNLNYLEVHSDIFSLLKINDQCYYKGYNYKCIESFPDEDYGFARSIFEQIKIPMPSPDARGFILTEDGGFLLLESGEKIQLEGDA